MDFFGGDFVICKLKGARAIEFWAFFVTENSIQIQPNQNWNFLNSHLGQWHMPH